MRDEAAVEAALAELRSLYVPFVNALAMFFQFALPPFQPEKPPVDYRKMQVTRMSKTPQNKAKLGIFAGQKLIPIELRGRVVAYLYATTTYNFTWRPMA